MWPRTISLLIAIYGTFQNQSNYLAELIVQKENWLRCYNLYRHSFTVILFILRFFKFYICDGFVSFRPVKFRTLEPKSMGNLIEMKKNYTNGQNNCYEKSTSNAFSMLSVHFIIKSIPLIATQSIAIVIYRMKKNQHKNW